MEYVDLTRYKGHYIKLAGYNRRMNPKKEYKRAKQPIDKNWRVREGDVDGWNGWIGWKLPKNIAVVDIDDATTAETVCPHFDTLTIKTPHGAQMIFKIDKEKYANITSAAKYMTRLGVIVDYRTDKGQIVVPNERTENRKYVNTSEPADFPDILMPLRKAKLGDTSLLPLLVGERNDRLKSHACSLARMGVPKDMGIIMMHQINNMIDPLTDKEIEDMTDGAYDKFFEDPMDENGLPLWFSVYRKAIKFSKPSLLVEHLLDIHKLIPLNTKKYYMFDERVYRQLTPKELYDLFKSHLLNDSMQNSWYNTLKAMMECNQEDINMFNRNDDIIVFKNGTFQCDNKGIQQVEDNPEYHSTIEIPYHYDPDVRCDNWIKNLDRILPDKDDQGILQELFGYLLVPNNKAKKIFVLYGPGNTGKTLILRVLQELLGIDNICTKDLGQLNERFQSTALVGKTANLIDDQDFLYMKSSGIIKSITGGGLIGGEIKGGDHITFENYARIVYTCNRIPQSSDKGDAWVDRHLIIPFVVIIPEEEKIPEIAEYFDYTGIVNWAVEGLIRLRNRKWRFKLSKNIGDAREEYKKCNDPFIKFLDECCILGEEHEEPYQSLFEAYKQYTDSRQSNSKFSAMLSERFKRVSKHRKIYYSGLCLDPDQADLYGLILGG